MLTTSSTTTLPPNHHETQNETLLYLPEVDVKPFPIIIQWSYVENNTNNTPFTAAQSRNIEKAYQQKRVGYSFPHNKKTLSFDFNKMLLHEKPPRTLPIKRIELLSLPEQYVVKIPALTEEQLSNTFEYAVVPCINTTTNTSSTNVVECAICLEPFTETDNAVCLPECKNHGFHNQCLQLSLNVKPACPLCRTFAGDKLHFGACPDGIMSIRFLHESLPGYEGYPTISIYFWFPSGVQDSRHPTPGKVYNADSRCHYMPATPIGRKVLILFKIAWYQRVLFKIGTSLTRNVSDVIIYADIHMKSEKKNIANQNGTIYENCFGWPDTTYFHRVTQEIYDAGVRVLPEHEYLFQNV